jgi:hypothetical protein
MLQNERGYNYIKSARIETAITVVFITIYLIFGGLLALAYHQGVFHAFIDNVSFSRADLDVKGELEENIIEDVTIKEEEYANDAASLSFDVIAKVSEEKESEIMAIHKNFIREIDDKGFIDHDMHLKYHSALAEYNIGSKILIADNNISESWLHLNESIENPYERFDITPNSVVRLSSFYITDKGEIIGYGGYIVYNASTKQIEFEFFQHGA